jgi:hypothetical protein
MGPNKKDAVLQTTELKNSVFATAGSYPLEGGYVYVCFLIQGLVRYCLITIEFLTRCRSMSSSMKLLYSSLVLEQMVNRSSRRSHKRKKRLPTFLVSDMVLQHL